MSLLGQVNPSQRGLEVVDGSDVIVDGVVVIVDSLAGDDTQTMIKLFYMNKNFIIGAYQL